MDESLTNETAISKKKHVDRWTEWKKDLIQNGPQEMDPERADITAQQEKDAPGVKGNLILHVPGNLPEIIP